MIKDNLPSVVRGSPPTISEAHVESFMVSLRASGYAECKLRDKRRIVLQYLRWTQDLQMPATEVNETQVADYLKPFVAHISKYRLAFKRSLLLLFLRHLREEGVIPHAPVVNEDTPEKHMEQAYADYLREERGLSFRTLLVYLPHVRAFLADRVAKTGGVLPGDFTAEVVRTYLLDRIRDRSTEYTRLLIVSLRSFLNFLFLRGLTPIDLSLSLIPFRKPQEAAVHKFILPAEVERVLSTPDLATATGRRDHAILLLLARMGLRAGEVVVLELDDISWRTAELVVRGKGRVCDRLPLLEEVGKALAHYIESDRGPCQCRRVFLRCIAPRIGLSGPAAIGHVVRRALVCAGLPSPSHRGAAHLFRHSLATQMVRHGASLTEISEILRHRSTTTTEIYAKVDFEGLREVARPWPGMEDVK